MVCRYMEMTFEQSACGLVLEAQDMIFNEPVVPDVHQLERVQRLAIACT